MPKKRKKKIRRVWPNLRIFCEGEKTEPNYINSYIDSKLPGNKTLRVVVVEKTDKTTPLQLVEEAIAKKDSYLTPDGDIFWVVFDRESVAKYKDELHAKAQALAKENGIKIALSNVCFELWLLLHLCDSAPPKSKCDEVISQTQFKKELRLRGVADYKKGSKELYSFLANAICDARKRAKMMNARTRKGAEKGKSNPYQLNPYTDVHLLLDAIDSFGRKRC
ncbi:MAG: RloB family protein [Candidatus Sedimenticola sp. (ex Thyasira tokunagai)]